MSDSPQYDTAGRLTQCSIILRGDCYKKILLTWQNLNRNQKHILTHYLVTQVDSNYKKNS